MSNSLVPIATPSWQPPQAKAMGKGIAIVATLGGIALAAYAVKLFVPTITDAVNLLQELLASTIKLGITGAVLFALAILLYHTYSPNGAINKLIRLNCESFINRLTWATLEVDPLSPYYERQKEVRAHKRLLSDASDKLAGVVAHFREQTENYRKEAATRFATAKSAQNQVAKGEVRFKVTAETEMVASKRCEEMAADFLNNYNKLKPVHDRVQQMCDAAEVIDRNLDNEIRFARTRWEAQKKLEDVNKATRSIFRDSERANIAAQAAQIIDLKYANEIGALEAMIRETQPLLDSIDLEKASANDELIARIENLEPSAPILLEAPKVPESVGVRSLIQ